MNRGIVIVLICWGLWAFLEKLAVSKIHPAQIQIINCIIGCLLIPIYFGMLKAKNVVATINFIGVLYVVAASLCATIASYTFFHVLKSNEVGTTTIISSTYPIITLLLGAIFLGEAITMPKIVGTFLVLLGIALLGR